MRALIAFDLDGVLYSAEAFLGEAYRDAIANVNERRPGSFPRVPTTREILDHVGWPVPVILQRLFPAIEPAAVELLYDETLRVIAAYVRQKRGELFPDVVATLQRLRAGGFTLVVASNGRRPYIEAVLETYDLVPLFDRLITVDRGRLDDKASVLRAYLAHHAIAAAQMTMVGDRTSDVEAAQAVGAPFIGCDYGHGYRDELEGAGPIVASFAAVADVVESQRVTP